MKEVIIKRRAGTTIGRGITARFVCEAARADLWSADLRNANLRYADLWSADLRNANLRNANLRYADLRYADLRDADLEGANLEGADLRRAYLWGVNLEGANLEGADLRHAYLEGADLRDADLRDADLRRAYLKGAKYDATTKVSAYGLPDGDLQVYKTIGGILVTLKVPANVPRTASLVGRKCRSASAVVVAIDGKDEVTSNGLGYGVSTIYRIGETVVADNYDDNPFIECTHGIHWYCTKKEALDSGF